TPRFSGSRSSGGPGSSLFLDSSFTGEDGDDGEAGEGGEDAGRKGLLRLFRPFDPLRPLRLLRPRSSTFPRPPAGQGPPSVLLSRDVHSPTHERAEQRGVGAGWVGARVLDAGFPLEAEARDHRGRAAHGWTGVRLSAGLVSQRSPDRLRLLSRR